MLRLGMIGLDTSHVPAFVRMMNAVERISSLNQVQVVAAWPAGNPEFPLSRDRVAGFTSEVAAMGVRIVDSIEQLMPLCDGIMVQSVDGRQHLEQAAAVFAVGKPVFIDKPLAASLSDVVQIAELGRQSGVPWFTASSMRFTAGYPELKNDVDVGRIVGCDTFGPTKVMPGHPDLFWYGVHGVDLLYSVMGIGCEQVTAEQTEYSDHVTGKWRDGRLGTFRGIREQTGFAGWGATVFGTAGIRHVSNTYDYEALVIQIAKFFLTGRSPVAEDEMVEVFAFLAAAEESRKCGGRPVKLAAVIDAAMSAN